MLQEEKGEGFGWVYVSESMRVGQARAAWLALSSGRQQPALHLFTECGTWACAEAIMLFQWTPSHLLQMRCSSHHPPTLCPMCPMPAVCAAP